MLRLIVLASLLGLGCKQSTPLQPCKRGAVFGMHVVDNDSAYMKKLFARVGSDRKGDPTDPDAQQTGIRADVDQWRHETVNEDGLPVDSRTYTDYYLTSPDKAALERYLATLDLPPADRELRLEPMPPLRDAPDQRTWWRTYLVIKAPMLATDAIGRVRTGTNPITNGPVVLVDLTASGRDAFSKGTAAVQGKKVATVIDGQVFSAPIIQEQITGGMIGINVSSSAAASELVTKLGCVK